MQIDDDQYMKAATLAALFGVLQISCMWVGYGATLWSVSIPRPIALVLLLASPIAAAYGEFRVLNLATRRVRPRIILALVITVVATYTGLYLSINYFGK